MGYSPSGPKELDMTEKTNTFKFPLLGFHKNVETINHERRSQRPFSPTWPNIFIFQIVKLKVSGKLVCPAFLEHILWSRGKKNLLNSIIWERKSAVKTLYKCYSVH